VSEVRCAVKKFFIGTPTFHGNSQEDAITLQVALGLQARVVYVIVRPQSTVQYTSVASVSTVDCGLTNLIHDRYSSDVEWLCLTGLQHHPYVVCSHSRLFTLGSNQA